MKFSSIFESEIATIPRLYSAVALAIEKSYGCSNLKKKLAFVILQC